ncbi:tRNA pseudouridine synthase [Peniophora sp. CONT]|nr:tRNA pseudouridine synthase [Peniophora sp. CONT]
MSPDYSAYTREQLLARIKALEEAMPGVPLHLNAPTPLISSKKAPIGAAKLVASSSKLAQSEAPPIDLKIHARRKIAIRFSYAGDEYNGLAHQTLPTPLPTVEGALFAAMAKARLIDPAGGFEACGWERSGRTDRGVSGAGNVVSVWVRSQLRDNPGEGAWEPPGASEDTEKSEVLQEMSEAEGTLSDDDGLGAFADLDLDAAPARTSIPDTPTHSRELRYAHMLNLILPPSIRIIAWSPVTSEFSARFSTLRRHYKYFFSPRGMDLDRMCEAAAKMTGEHDWRNLCRVDASKQLTSFRRRVFRADISKCSNLDSDLENPGVEGLYVFDLVGSGFLYNQVRHIMAVLFLVGSGLEPPSIIDALLNADASSPNPDPSVPLLERRPEYLMADALPLVLWDCAYKDEDVNWRSDAGIDEDDGPGAKSVHFQLSGALERAKIHTALDACFLAAAARFHPPQHDGLPLASPSDVRGIGFANVLLGGGTNARVRRYVPLLERERRESVEEINRKWREGRGKRRKGRVEDTPTADAGDE